MRRIVSVFLPMWPIDRLMRRCGLVGHNPRGGRVESAFILIEVARGKQLVTSCCRLAASRGVAHGMPLVEARSLLAGVPVIEAPAAPQRDAAALDALAAWSIRFSPLVAADPPDGLLLDVTGCARLYGDERRLLNRIGNAFGRLRVHSRLACAGTIGCAAALARYGERERASVESGNERDAIKSLPIESLRIDHATIEALHEVNIDRIGQLLVIPALELASRFESVLLLRLAQAIGERPEVIEPVRPVEPMLVERSFDGAVTDLESLCIASRELVDALMTMLARIESGATWLELILIRLDASPVQATIRLSRASRDARHLWSLLRPRIERMNLGYGIERIVLRARAARRLPHDQLEQPYGGGEHDRAAVDRASGELIDTLVHRLGRERALRISVHESHRPERVTQHVSAMDHIPSATATVAIAEGDRPSQLFETPEPVEAMALTPDGPPTSLRWRGEQLSIIAAHGPHRISGEWWNGSADRAARDYFKVQDADGRWLWVFRDLERGRWFVHGEWA